MILEDHEIEVNPIAVQPVSTDLVSAFKELAFSSQHNKAKKNLNLIASRDPRFHLNVIKILQNMSIEPQIRLIASTYVKEIIQQNIQTTRSEAQFQMLLSILLNQKIELACKLTFVKALKTAIQTKPQCARIEKYIHLAQSLFQGDINSKILALSVLENQALADQDESTFAHYVNVVMIPMTKSIIPLTSLDNTQLLIAWASACSAVINKLVILSDQAVNSTQSIDLLSFLCSHQCFSELVLKCYFIDGQSDSIYEMKNHISLFHKAFLTQVFKLDEKCTTVHFKAMQSCLSPFIESLSDIHQVMANEQFSINIIGVLGICASNEYFNQFFITNYISIIHYLLPLFKLDEIDISNFESEPQEFVLQLDDAIDQKTSETLKCESAKFLVSLVNSVDGAATYVCRLCFEALKARAGGEEKININLDQVFLILASISHIFSEREDLNLEIKEIFINCKQHLLTFLTDIELSMLYFFLALSYDAIFEKGEEGIPYVVSAATSSSNPSVNAMGIQFISNLTEYQTNIYVFKHLTERLRTEELQKYSQLYEKYLTKILKNLSEDDLISVTNILMERIKNQMGNQKTSHNIVLAFNILSIISNKHNLLQIDVNLKANLKQIYPLVANTKLKCMDNVLEIVEHILLAESKLETNQYSLLPHLTAIITYNGSVDAVFFTLAIFIRKTNIKDSPEIISYILEMVKLASKPTGRTIDFSDIGKGLLLFQLFLRKFGCVLNDQAKKEILNFLPTVRLLESDNLKACVTNVYLKMYPYFASPEFKSSLLSTVQQNEKIFLGYQRTSLIHGLCEMVLMETSKNDLETLLYILVRKVQEHQVHLKLKPTKKKSKQYIKNQRQTLDKCANTMLQFVKKQDLFGEFQNTITTLKQSNPELFSAVMSSFPEYFILALKELLGKREVSSEIREVYKIKSAKQNVQIEEIQQGQTNKRKRAP